jgi:hypothetical protein
MKWENVDFDRRITKVVETRVYGEEGKPKTNSFCCDCNLLPKPRISKYRPGLLWKTPMGAPFFKKLTSEQPPHSQKFI